MQVVREVAPAEDHATPHSDELTDEQIEELLKQAETRLREQQAVKLASGRHTPAVPAAGKLDISNLPKPYVQKSGEIARADKHRLLDEKNRKLAESGIRKVEDPVLVKNRELEVCYSYYLCDNTLPMRKTFPKLFFLDAESRAPSWCSSAIYESFIFIVTLRHLIDLCIHITNPHKKHLLTHLACLDQESYSRFSVVQSARHESYPRAQARLATPENARCSRSSSSLQERQQQI
jgi:hypothetical protein